MDCIGCKKTLKKGEFVILNGGSMKKTRSGASMEDKDHIGFLSVHNHFDSKKNYRTFIITDHQPNGQFEFYACSHKCLADYMQRSIMQLKKFDAIKKFEMAPQTKLDKIGYKWADKVVQLMGFTDAMITDESMIGDFTDWRKTKEERVESLKKLSKKFKFEIKVSDFIWEVAKKLKLRDK